jgi:hypothetical protein
MSIASLKVSAMTHHPHFPVQEGILDELVLEGLGAAIVVKRESSLHELSLLGAQELGGIRVIVKHPEGSTGDSDSSNTFKDEDPLPSVVSRNTVHFVDESCKQTSERTGGGGGGEEQGDSEVDLVPTIPLSKVEADTGEETGFRDSQEDSCDEETLKVFDKAHSCRGELYQTCAHI